MLLLPFRIRPRIISQNMNIVWGKILIQITDVEGGRNGWSMGQLNNICVVIDATDYGDESNLLVMQLVVGASRESLTVKVNHNQVSILKDLNAMMSISSRLIGAVC